MTDENKTLEWQLSAAQSQREIAITLVRSAARKLMVRMMEIQHNPDADHRMVGVLSTELTEARAQLAIHTEVVEQLRTAFKTLGVEVVDRMPEMKANGMYGHTPSVFERIREVIMTANNELVTLKASAALRGEEKPLLDALRMIGVLPFEEDHS